VPKPCPKCKTVHEKPGTYCSRKCSNSRTWTTEQNEKRSKSNTISAKQRWNLQGAPTKKQLEGLSKGWKNSVKARQEKLDKADISTLGYDARRNRVIKEQDQKCFRCENHLWLEKKIILELHHKDGNNQNNIRSNLEALCPNCHSMTDTWRGRVRR
jgi:5-methylcytosine-specific restriction endonuclease McrA